MAKFFNSAASMISMALSKNTDPNQVMTMSVMKLETRMENVGNFLVAPLTHPPPPPKKKVVGKSISVGGS